jgi:hypothetical protein
MLADIFANALIQLDEFFVTGRNDPILSSFDEIENFGELGCNLSVMNLRLVLDKDFVELDARNLAG